MSKAQRYKQQQKDKKQAKSAPKVAEPKAPKTLKEQQAEAKEQMRKHLASAQRLKEFEAKLHPKPAGAEEPAKEKSALQDMFFDGGNLSKDQGRTSHVALHHEKASPSLAPRAMPGVSHEKDTTIKI